MSYNYGDMFNKLSEQHKLLNSVVSILQEKNKKLFKDNLAKDAEIKKSIEQINDGE
jgi:hypothetical protein